MWGPRCDCRQPSRARSARRSPPRSKPASRGCKGTRSICFSFTTPSSTSPRAPISPRPPCWRKSCRPSSCCASRASCASSASPLTARPRRCTEWSMRALDTGQVSYNLLNPSPGGAVPAGYPAQDYGNLLGHMQAAEMGVINIRVLAAGALSGTEERHPLGSPPPAPIGSGADYRSDVERARRFEPLVREGHADSLIEAALRYVIVQRAVSTVLAGYSTLEQLEYAARSIEKGPLSPAALNRVADIQRAFVGELR